MAGSSIRWLEKNMGIIKSEHEIESLAASVADSGGVYFVPAFSGLYAPHWRTDARGLVNLSFIFYLLILLIISVICNLILVPTSVMNAYNNFRRNL